jgi:hypothetical protein
MASKRTRPAKLAVAAPSRLARGGKLIRVDLQRLKLPGPIQGSFIRPIALSPEGRETLRKWLDDALIARLLEALEAAREFRRYQIEQPKLGEERAALRALIDLMDGAAYILENGSASLETALDEISYLECGEFGLSRRVFGDLVQLAEGCARFLDRTPLQSRRASDVYSVACIAQHVQSVKIFPSEGPESRFVKICEVLWPVIGNSGSPIGSIRAYLKSGGEMTWIKSGEDDHFSPADSGHHS